MLPASVVMISLRMRTTRHVQWGGGGGWGGLAHRGRTNLKLCMYRARLCDHGTIDKLDFAAASIGTYTGGSVKI